jgi:CheY-like chemotaxis protein
MPGLLDGRRILVLDDEYLGALQLVQLIEDHGGMVIGLAARADDALALARSEQLDGAFLDVKLNGGNSYSVADELMAGGVPVIFVTGYHAETLPERFATAPAMRKPLSKIASERVFRKVFSA